MPMDLKPYIRNGLKSLVQKAKLCNMKTQHTYNKAITSLDGLDGSIYVLEDLKNLNYFGESTIKKIQNYIDKEFEKVITNSVDLDEFKSVVSNKFYLKKQEELISGKKEVKEKKIKKYIPGYKTGGYAILRALWIGDGITKYTIAHRAKNYCDSDFDFLSKYSAWNSIKTLIKRELVYKEGKNKYYLTQKGKDLSESMFKDSSCIKEEDTTIKLIIDTREVKSKRQRDFFQNFFDSKEIKNETRALAVGDFIWIRGEDMCNCIVERKGGDDFISSIEDGRFKEQKQRLYHCGLDRIFYIVEGLKKVHNSSLNSGYVQSCLTATKLEGFTVIETESINDTSEFITFLDSYVRKKYGTAKNIIKKEIHDDNEGANSMTILDPDDENDDDEAFKLTYASFIEKGDKGKNSNIENMFYMFLVSIRGITHEKAKVIAENYSTYSNFIKNSKEKDFEEKLITLGKTVKLTKRNIEHIKELLLTETSQI